MAEYRHGIAAPKLLGLCPGEHLLEFYVPLDAGESQDCPMCDCRLVVYAPLVRDDASTVKEMAEALTFYADEDNWWPAPLSDEEVAMVHELGEPLPARVPAIDDQGQRARAALTIAQGDADK